jgi:SSS family solute:Na+ symporter
MAALPVLRVAEASGQQLPEMSPEQERVYGTIRDYDGTEGAVSVDYVAGQTGLSRQQAGAIMTGLVKAGALKSKSDAVYAHMILELLPPGLRGVLAAALLAALMSTVSGALNSIATLFSYYLYRRWRPDTSDARLVMIGRIATFVAMLIAILWSPLVAHYQSIYQGINSIISYLAPPITTVFLWGIFWRRASSRAALATLIIGSGLGLIVFLLDWFKAQTGWNVQFMMMAFYLFVICSILLIVLSVIWPHQHTPQSERLVWRNPLDALHEAGWSGVLNYKTMAGLLFVIMILLYVVFATETTQRFFGLVK